MKEKINELRKKIRILEWDNGLNQINFSRIKRLKELKTELENLEKAVNDVTI